MIALNQEYSGANWVTVSSGPVVFAYSDKPTHTFGSGSIGLDFADGGPLAGFVAIDTEFGDNTTLWGARLGLRHTF